MKRVWLGGIAVAAVMFGASPVVNGQSAKPALAIPDAPVAQDLPGAKELPDPKMIYKVVFVVGDKTPNITDRSADLLGVARYVNTLAAHGVPLKNRKIAVVLHLEAAEYVQTNDAFKKRNNGYVNPNVALIDEMAKAGVEFHVCGQAVLARKIDPKNILPQVELDLWAATTVTQLQLRGYVRAGA